MIVLVLEPCCDIRRASSDLEIRFALQYRSKSRRKIAAVGIFRRPIVFTCTYKFVQFIL